MPDTERLLLEWYARKGRDLPWRSTNDPYGILVSEVMSSRRFEGRFWLNHAVSAGQFVARIASHGQRDVRSMFARRGDTQP
jgi:A/G-specific adenine glycosylase